MAAIQRPDLFKHLVLIGPNPCFLNDPGYVGGFERAELEDLLELMDRNFMGWADFLAPVVAGADERASRRLDNSFCSTDPAIARRFAEATFFADNRADLPLVSTPCLVLQHGRASCCPRHPCCDSPATAGCFPYLPFYRGSARRWHETCGLAKVCQERRGRLCSWCPGRPCRPVPSAECFVSHQSCSPTCPASCSFAFQPSCLGWRQSGRGGDAITIGIEKCPGLLYSHVEHEVQAILGPRRGVANRGSQTVRRVRQGQVATYFGHVAHRTVAFASDDVDHAASRAVAINRCGSANDFNAFDRRRIDQRQDACAVAVGALRHTVNQDIDVASPQCLSEGAGRLSPEAEPWHQLAQNIPQSTSCAYLLLDLFAAHHGDRLRNRVDECL